MDACGRPPAWYAGAFHAAPVSLMVMAPGDLTMIDANATYLRMVGLPRERVVGHRMLDVFPYTPSDDPDALDLPAFVRRTIDTKTQQTATELRYDIPTEDGGVRTHWWDVVETPVLSPDGEVAFLLHYAEDVTPRVRARAELAVVQAAQRAAAQQIASLAEVSLALSAATSVPELERIVTTGLRVLEVDGGAIATRATGGGWRVVASNTLGELVTDAYSPIPDDSHLPVIVATRTGERVLLPTRAATDAWGPEMAYLAAQTGRNAFAVLPLTVEKRTIGSLSVAWVAEHDLTPAELDLLDGFAAQCAQALHRIETSDAEHRTALQVADMAEALQQALLTPPPQRPEIDIAVRYQTAVDATRVGGDWYDAFEDRAGASVLVIGDVAGHDSAAAARMGQLRGILRTLAYLDAARPSDVLTQLEATARGLRVDALASAVLARVEQLDGRRIVRWSNAGHPPPVMVTADGTATVLKTRADLLLGVDASHPRHDHVADFPDGATFVLYTDGLVERRAEGLDHGIRDLCGVLGDLATVPLAQVCDRLLDRLARHIGEDDVALLVARARC